MSKPIKIGIAVAVAVAATAFLIGPKPDKSPATSQETVGASGATTVNIVDPVHDRPFTVSTWLATGEDQHTLVVISHGFSGDRTSHDYLAAELASAGYTVAAPTHPDLAGIESDDHDLDPLVLRPRHLSLTIDYLSDTTVEPFERVIVVGHSLGSYSALRLVGANPSAAGLDEHCRANPTDEVLCTARMGERVERLVSEGTDFADDRVDAVVLLAPGYAPLFSIDELGTIDADILMIGAGNDDQLPGSQLDNLLSSLPHNTESLIVDGGHYIFLRECTAEESSALPEMCADTDGVERAEVRSIVVSEVERFASAV